MLNNIIDRIKLPFRKEKELYMSLYEIIGIYPHDISLYKLALMHKSMFKRNAKGKPINNERLEFLGDAILDAAVGDIVYRHFPGKREGFLTNTRSKLVQRDTLNRLAQEMGITKLILSNGRAASHNSYMGGNAFEALVGAIYLDRGYDACMRFIKKRILAQMINIDKVAYKEVNFKSKLIEWTQKNRVQLEFVLTDQHKDKNGSPVFGYRVVIEEQEGCEATGYSKKESQQLASKRTLEKLKKEPGFLDAVFAAKTNRTKMEEMPVETVPSTEQPDDFFTDKALQLDAANAPTTTNNNEVNDEAIQEEVVTEEAVTEEAVTEAVETETATHEKGSEQKGRKNRAQRHSPMYADNYTTKTEKDAQNAKESLSSLPEIEEADDDDDEADEFDLSHITHRDKSREDIIAEAERMAFESMS